MKTLIVLQWFLTYPTLPTLHKSQVTANYTSYMHQDPTLYRLVRISQLTEKMRLAAPRIDLNADTRTFCHFQTIFWFLRKDMPHKTKSKLQPFFQSHFIHMPFTSVNPSSLASKTFIWLKIFSSEVHFWRRRTHSWNNLMLSSGRVFWGE